MAVQLQMFGYQACHVCAQLEHVFSVTCPRLDENDGNYCNYFQLKAVLKTFVWCGLQVLAKQQALQQQQMSALQTAAQRQRALALMCRYVITNHVFLISVQLDSLTEEWLAKTMAGFTYLIKCFEGLRELS